MVYNWESPFEKCEFLVNLYIRDSASEVLRKERYKLRERMVMSMYNRNDDDLINEVWKRFMNGRMTANNAVKYLLYNHDRELKNEGK